MSFQLEPISDGYITSGSSSEGNNGVDITIVRLDDTGNVLWQKTYGGIQDDYATGIKQTPDGGFVVCGYIENPDNTMENQLYVIKVDAQGNQVWDLKYGSDGESSYYGNDQVQKIQHYI